ncbi:MAG: methionine adenosyltransferase [Bacteroidales bacterium]
MPLYPKSMVFTSESVTEGHPDKFCDQVSDAVVDECLERDPNSRVACNAYVTMEHILVGGQVTSRAELDVAQIVRAVANRVGYTPAFGFDVDACTITRSLHRQSADIKMGVSLPGGTIGAGDQGLVFGFACNQTTELMPLPIMLAHKLAMRLADVRKKEILSYLGPDGKTQVTVEYRDGKPLRVDQVVIAAQHSDEVLTRDGERMTDDAKQEIIARVVTPVLGRFVDRKTRITVNGAGRFLVGGPQANTGLTGRKVAVDTYGGWAPHGGGTFSGKDPTKVDRSAGYMARYVAKNVLAAGLADECLVQLAYCIGGVEPVSVMVTTSGTGTLPDDALSKLVRQVFPLSPRGMIEHLRLLEPVYQKTAVYGHFGRTDVDLPWERTDMADELLAKLIKA